MDRMPGDRRSAVRRAIMVGVIVGHVLLLLAAIDAPIARAVPAAIQARWPLAHSSGDRVRAPSPNRPWAPRSPGTGSNRLSLRPASIGSRLSWASTPFLAR